MFLPVVVCLRASAFGPRSSGWRDCIAPLHIPFIFLCNMVCLRASAFMGLAAPAGANLITSLPNRY